MTFLCFTVFLTFFEYGRAENLVVMLGEGKSILSQPFQDEKSALDYLVLTEGLDDSEQLLKLTELINMFKVGCDGSCKIVENSGIILA